jgi:micrococcal nuclease
MYEYRVQKVLRTYDGDTMTVRLDLGFDVTKVEKIRLAFIDAPELKGEEHDKGIESRDWLRAKVKEAEDNNYTIVVRTLKDNKGKYGRYIGIIYINGIDINQQMMAEGLAIPYAT